MRVAYNLCVRYSNGFARAMMLVSILCSLCAVPAWTWRTKSGRHLPTHSRRTASPEAASTITGPRAISAFDGSVLLGGCDAHMRSFRASTVMREGHLLECLQASAWTGFYPQQIV